MQLQHLKKIVEPLLQWYSANERILPWRQNTDPYRVWVSEIMLQQTRVETVIPYYERFMERFPTIQSLARSDDEELLKLWEGLGYYSRVRNLKKAAQVICSEYEGKFPQGFEVILKLPGIGTYTAGAISSIAFEKARAAVDGNVLRVITRLTENVQDITDIKFRKQITEELEKVYPQSRRGDFTQSLMELGAMVCVPNGAPKCQVCPLNMLCGACQNQTQMQYPVKKKKAQRKIEQKTILILLYEDKIALSKRSEEGLLSGMWELPNLKGNKSEKEIIQWLSDREIVAERRQQTERIQKKHVFSHIEWHMECEIMNCREVGMDNIFTWVTKEQLQKEIALPTAFKKVYEAAVKLF